MKIPRERKVWGNIYILRIVYTEEARHGNEHRRRELNPSGCWKKYFWMFHESQRNEKSSLSCRARIPHKGSQMTFAPFRFHCIAMNFEREIRITCMYQAHVVLFRFPNSQAEYSHKTSIPT